MADNFDKLVKALVEYNKSQDQTTDAVDKLTKTMEDHFKFLKRQMKDQEEDRREAVKAKGEARAASPSTKSAGKGLGIGILGGGGIARMLLPLTAGIAATAAALSGLRGWELNAIKTIKDMIKVPTVLSNGILKIRNSTLGMFGLTAEGLLTRDAKGRFQRTAPITTQIGMRMNALRIRALNVFGLGADGKPIPSPNKGGKVSFSGSVITKATNAIGVLLSPIADVSKAITGYMGGGGKALFTWIGTLAKGSVGWLSVLGKILKPIGFIFSIKAAYDDFVSSDKTSLLEKSTDAVGAFFGDFIGAPVELLKDLLSGAFKLIGWDDAAKTLDDIDLVKGITKAFQDVLDIPRELFNWVGTLFSDPAKAGQMAWDTFLAGFGIVKGTYSTLVDIMLWPVNKFFSWIGELLGWKDPKTEDMDIRATVTSWVTDFWTWLTGWLPDISQIASDLTSSITEMLPEWLQNSLGLTGQDADAKALADAAREQGLIKAILKADTNADGIITAMEASKLSKMERRSLMRQINDLNDLRGGTLGSSAELVKNGQMVIINNVDASTNSGDTTSVSNRHAGADGSYGMSAIDKRTLKEQMINAYGFN